jgi:signal transduction histidine kinase
VSLELELAPGLPDVRVDPMQLEQALVEVISNAVDAMPDGGRLRIAARADDAPGGRGRGARASAGVTIEVVDTGAGIPEHALPSVCEPFFTTRPEGTGLGLAIAKRYVEQNHGRIEIVSRLGETVVRVLLPAAVRSQVAV